jgi:hypothetical protein
LTGFEKENYSYLRRDAVIQAAKGLTHLTKNNIYQILLQLTPMEVTM